MRTVDKTDSATRGYAAIILAAGLGTRAKGFKPLFQWRGESYLSKVFTDLKKINQFQEILVVTGYGHSLLDPLLRQLQASSVWNENYRVGMHSSIKLGLCSLRTDWAGALIAHIDHPHLESDDYNLIVNEFYQKEALVRPMFRTQPGNPAMLGKKFLSEILAEPDQDCGCSYLFKRYPHEISYVQMDSDRCLYSLNGGISN